jgi:hypothetical protein
METEAHISAWADTDNRNAERCYDLTRFPYSFGALLGNRAARAADKPGREEAIMLDMRPYSDSLASSLASESSQIRPGSTATSTGRAIATSTGRAAISRETKNLPARWQDNRRAALARYGRRNQRLIEAFNYEVAQGSPTARLYNSFVLQVVSDYLWERPAGQPGWEALDVDAFQRSILQERLALDEVAIGNFNLTVTAFYSWLARRSLLRPAQAARIIRRLRRDDNAYLSRLPYRLAPRGERAGSNSAETETI